MAVRREKVILELQDDFSRKIAEASAEVGLLKRELDGLGGSAGRTHRPLNAFERDATRAGLAMDRGGNSIDRYSGRLGLLADALKVLGPGLVPITTSLVPAITGFSNELGFAVVGAGTAVLAFHGLGEAMKSMSDYQLEPTTEHLQKMQEEMIKLGPAGSDFAKHLMALQPVFDRLQQTARAGLFPGLTDAIDVLATRTPEVAKLIATVSTTMGDLARSAGTALAGPEWDGFFQSLITEARPALTDMASAAGSVAHGLAEMWQAFIPLSNDFGSGLAEMAAEFDKWATGLSATEGFQHFIAYVRESGPEVLHLVGSLANMLVQIGRAAAPLGGPVLKSLTAIANAIAKIAGSDLGTPIFTAIAALTLYNRAMQATVRLQETAFGSRMVAGTKATALGLGSMTTNLRSMRGEYSRLGPVQATLLSGFSGTTSAAKEMRSTLGSLGKGAAMVGGLAVASSGLAGKMGLANTATDALLGTMIAPGWGTAIGALVGGLQDASDAAASMSTNFDTLAKSSDPVAIATAYKEAQEQLKKLHDESHSWNPLDAFKALGTQVGGLFHGLGFVDLNKRLADAKTKMDQMSSSERLAAAAAGAYGARQQEAARSTLAARSAAAETANSFVGLGKNVNNAKVSLNGWIHQMEASAQALTEFGNNAQTAAKRGLDDGLIAALRKAGPEGALRMKQLANGTAQQIARANKSWAEGQAAVEEYQHQVAGTPKTIATELELREANAMLQIQRIKAALRGIPRSISTQYYVNQVNAISKPRSLPGNPSGFFSGGYTGDYPVKRPVGVVHGNEFVFDAVSTARAGVENLYAMQRRLRGYERGGFVDPSPSAGRPGLTAYASFTSASVALDDFISSTRQASSVQRKVAKALRPAAKSFNLTEALSVREIDREFNAFSRAVHKAGYSLTDSFGRLERQAEKNVRAFDKAAGKLSNLRQSASSARSTATGAFTHDIFGGSLSDLTTQLSADRNDANAMRAAIAQGKRHGLSGAFAAQLESSGNVALAQQIADASRSQIHGIEASFKSRNQSASAVGSQAASFYANAIHAQTSELKELRRALNKLEGAVERGAEKGTHKGASEANHKARDHAAAVRRGGK